MPGLFSDIRSQIKQATNDQERELFQDRMAEALDQMRNDLMAALQSKAGGSSGNPTSDSAKYEPPQSQQQGVTSGKPGTPLTQTDDENSDREAFPAAGQLIVADQLVSFRLESDGTISAYLARADDSEYPAHAICVNAVFTNGGSRRIKCNRSDGKKKQMRIRLATSGTPAVGAEMHLSAIIPGAVTDNPSDSPNRQFNQRIGTFVRLATNAQKQVQTSVGIIDVEFSPPASFAAAASA